MTLTLRSDIIQIFRDRIHNSARLRLSKDELEVLIGGFVALLQEAESETQIREICEAEIALLEEGYPQASVAKYLTRYRKAIASAIEEGTLVLTEVNSHRFVHQQRVTGIREERLEHWAMTYLKYSPEVYEGIDRRSQLVNQGKQLNLRLVPVERYLGLLREFLGKRGQFEARWLATAVAGLTGRRFAEVVAKGAFSLTAHPYLLRFEGQLKSRAGHGEGYDIVTLVPATEVLEAIERLRRLPEVKAITKLKGAELSAALNAFNQKLNSVTGKVLIQVVPPLEGKKTVSVHNLRSLYGAIAVYLFCPQHQHEYAFVQHFLGHVMDSPATGHYFRFALCDDQGGLLRDKGVLLDRVPELPIGRAQSVSKDDGLSLEVSPSQSTVTPPWQILLERRLEGLRAEFEAQLKEVRKESEAGWFIRRIEGLERENLQLRSQLERAQAGLPSGESTHVAQIAQDLALLRAENLSLSQQLKLANDTLDGFRRLLNGTDGTDGTDAAANLNVKVSESGEEADPITAPGETTISVTPTAVPRSHGAGKAFKRAAAIVEAIKVWNQYHPSESFAISPGLLETVFRIHRQAAKEFFEAYQNELWDYHQEIGVESPRWHNRGKDSEKLKMFVQERLI